MLRISLAANPDVNEIAESLESALKQYVEFDYEPQTETRMSASAIEQRADTLVVPPPEKVKGFLEGKEGAKALWQTKDGRTVLTIRNMNRRKKMDTGTGYHARQGMSKGEYLFRTFRLEGVKLATVTVAKKTKLFPAASL